MIQCDLFTNKSKLHLNEVEGFNKKRGGYKGGHNYENLIYSSIQDRLLKVISIEKCEIDGVYEIEYTVNNKDTYNNIIRYEWNKSIYKKTVFDPKIISLDKIHEYAQEAFINYICIDINDEIYIKGSARNRLKFEGWIDRDSGELKSYYPVLNWTVEEK